MPPQKNKDFVTMSGTSSSEDSYNTDDEKQEKKVPPRKKKKIEQKYRSEWEKQFPWITAVKGTYYY